MSDMIEKMRGEIQERMKEIQPMVDEYRKLEAAERELSRITTAKRPRRKSGVAGE